MDLYSAWKEAKEGQQYLVRKEMPVWGIARHHNFAESYLAASMYGMEYVHKKDWMIVDEKPEIVKDPADIQRAPRIRFRDVGPDWY